MIDNLICWTGICLLCYAVYKWATAKFDYFEKRGVSYLKPKYFFGNNVGFMMVQKCTMNEFIEMIYNANPEKKILGTFEFRQPALVVRDPETIKQVFVKDFDHFEDHRTVIDDKVDILFGNSLFFLTGSKWRDMRATLSPAFTGSKMRQMFDLISECGEQMAGKLTKEIESLGTVDYEMKELFGKYANDVISSAAFGYKINSFDDPTNEFYLSGKKFLEIGSGKGIARLMTILMLPKVASLLNISIIDQKITNFFRSIVMDNIESRDKQGIFRPDMINILMNVKKGNSHLNNSTDEKQRKDGFASVEESSIGTKTIKRKWTDDEIVAQCFLFFLAGFDTTSTVLSFATYELALNPDIQKKLYEEIKETHKSLGGQSLTYDVLQNMKYLDMVISESLRFWPPAPAVDRICVKDYDYNDGQCKFQIEKGTVLLIPIYGLHFDEKYWDNPKKFNPERFSDENKGRITNGTYAPFGVGPRNCIGSRFALMAVKSVIYYLLLNFEVVPNRETEVPIKLKKSPVGLAAANGIHVAMKLRQ